MAQEAVFRSSHIADQSIIEALPQDERVTQVEAYGKSAWALTAKLCVQKADGSIGAYFLKTDDAAERNVHFYLCDYLNLRMELPDPVKLGKSLAELHRKSRSPTGQFGFHVTTFDGKLPLHTTWESNWTTFFQRLLRGVWELDRQLNGAWAELDAAMDTVLAKVVPRLLDPLTADGRTLKPCLIHGDLWESNIGTDADTGDVYIYDACAYYAHHEKEIAMWRVAHHRMQDPRYTEEYLKHYPPSEPVGEFEDRARLYALQTLVIHAAHYPGAETRRTALEECRALVARYVEADS
ncbi:Fructosamine/Ketosamine-3-kinase [Xylariomycetidae sp. FL0641]|nr:Fructosamine/Ketosamine-3-kinase [Xylariomycetidae sp. FL0641]